MLCVRLTIIACECSPAAVAAAASEPCLIFSIPQSWWWPGVEPPWWNIKHGSPAGDFGNQQVETFLNPENREHFTSSSGGSGAFSVQMMQTCVMTWCATTQTTSCNAVRTQVNAQFILPGATRPVNHYPPPPRVDVQLRDTWSSWWKSAMESRIPLCARTEPGRAPSPRQTA